MARQTPPTTIRFDARVRKVGTTTLVRLPEKASHELPSRGQVAVRGTINGRDFDTVVEPDGEFGHWMRVAGIDAGDIAAVEIAPAADWPEPKLPRDFEAALAAAPQNIKQMWKDITPMARWEWVRWVNATLSPDTRKRRIEVSISKMKSGKRRPCCFNLASCTDPELARNGRLRE